MIVAPLNDGHCLAQLHEAARAMARSDDAAQLARRAGSVAQLAALIRAMPQLDDGGGASGRDAVSCDVAQRLRRFPRDPNCFERAAMFLAVAERLEPSARWTSVTMDTPAAGRHTTAARLDGMEADVYNLTPIRTAPVRMSASPLASMRNASAAPPLSRITLRRPMLGLHGLRNADDVTSAGQDVFGVVHGIGKGILGAYGLGGAADAIGDEYEKAGLIKPRSKPATGGAGAPSAVQPKGKDQGPWPKGASKNESAAGREGWGRASKGSPPPRSAGVSLASVGRWR